MSVMQDLRTRAKHRGYTPWQLVQKIGRLEQEADEYACELVALTTQVDELKAERNRLADERDQEAVAHGAIVDDLRAENDQLRDELAALKVRFGPELAAEANANAITVPPMVRPIDGPEDEATQPIPVVPLHQAPFATTDPAHVPAWAQRD